MKKNILIAILAVGLFSFSANAQNDATAMHKMNAKEKFKKLDTDKDGRLSKAEVEKAGKPKFVAKFSAIDANKDGYLTVQELKTYRKQHKNDKPKGSK